MNCVSAYLIAFFPALAGALVISPSSKEVNFSYTAEFVTGQIESAGDLAAEHAKHLFGYMQNREQAKIWDLNHRILGIGAPAWKPEFTILSDLRSRGLRTIQYKADGRLLLIRSVAATLLAGGKWTVELPYELDNFYDRHCADKDYSEKETFWYFYDPFRKGCEFLRKEPLAQPTVVTLSNIQAPEDSPANLDELRVDNGHELFQVTTINGFDEGSRKRGDDGRKNYETMNEWFRAIGFEDTFISHYRARPIHQFDKVFKRNDGREVHIRLTRLLAETDLDDSDDVTFAKFFRKMVADSDVVIYEGHSGLGVNMDLAAIEKRAGGKIEFNPEKRQLFLFDSCSSYSYYLGMFEGKKNPGRLNVLTNGTESLFDYEITETKRLYKMLFDVNNNEYTWLEFMNKMEVPFRGTTFMLNLFINE